MRDQRAEVAWPSAGCASSSVRSPRAKAASRTGRWRCSTGAAGGGIERVVEDREVDAAEPDHGAEVALEDRIAGVVAAGGELGEVDDAGEAEEGEGLRALGGDGLGDEVGDGAREAPATGGWMTGTEGVMKVGLGVVRREAATERKRSASARAPSPHAPPAVGSDARRARMSARSVPTSATREACSIDLRMAS